MRLNKVKGIQMTDPGLLFHSWAFLLPTVLKPKLALGTKVEDSHFLKKTQPLEVGMGKSRRALMLNSRNPRVKRFVE